MAGRYERITNTHDAEDPETLTTAQAPPHSPPPSFHSRASSVRPEQRVDPNLADAFDAADDSDDDDDDDHHVDDRQRLVRGNASPGFAPPTHAPQPPPPNAAAAAAAAAAASRVYGGGIQSDGVFSNLTAKPERPSGEKEEQPPTYEQAAADAVPPYWETTILAPGFGGLDDVYIDGMPVGSLFSFVWNGMISMSFQLVGFLLTYLLHSTHAAKNGSRAGLGITLIQYGFYMKGSPSGGEGAGGGGAPSGPAAGMAGPGPDEGYATPPDPNAHEFDPASVGREGGGGGGGGLTDMAGSEWLAYVLMIVGWFILIRALSDYLKARRHEQLVRRSPDRGLGNPIIAEGEAAETVV